MISNTFRFFSVITALSLLAGCDAGRSTAPTYSVGLSASGLAGTLVVKNDFREDPSLAGSASHSASPREPQSTPISTQELTVTADGNYAFAQRLPSGTSYSVVVMSQPETQSCTVTNGAGSVGRENVTGIRVGCVAKRTTTLKVVAALDSALPGAIAAKIAKVASTAASANLGSALEVPAVSREGETFLYAVDVNENIVLAAESASSQTTLSADSTALALARLLLGAVPAAVKTTDVDAAIRATAAFPRLVTEINAALSLGTSPLASAAVFDTLNTVTSQLRPMVLAQLTAAGTPASALPVPVASRSPTASKRSLGPQQLFGWRGSDVQAVFLAAADSANSVKVANGMSIAWAASSTDNYGNRLCPQGNGRTNRCSVLLPAAAVLRPAGIAPSQLVQELPTAEVPANAGRAFKLTLNQDDASRKANMLHIVEDGVGFALAAVTDGRARPLAGNCGKELAAIMLPAEQLGALAANRSSVNFQRYLDTIGTGAVVESALAAKLATCSGGSDSSTRNVPAFSRMTLIFYRQFGLWITRSVPTVANAANMGLEAGLTLYYWNDSGTTVNVAAGRMLAAGPGRRQ